MVRSLLLALLLAPCGVMAQPVCVPTVQPQTVVRLAWVAPVLASGQSLSGFQLQRQVGTGAWVDLPAPAAVATTAQDTCAVGQTCTYRLYALGTVQSKPARSLEAPYGTPSPCVQVAATSDIMTVPQAFAASTQGVTLGIALTWKSSDAQRPVVVERIPVAGESILWTATVKGERLVVPGLADHTEYCYRAQYADGATWTPQACATTGR